jgi:hypothetical protein
VIMSWIWLTQDIWTNEDAGLQDSKYKCVIKCENSLTPL